MVRVDDRLHRYLKSEAARRGVTVANLVDVAITHWIDSNMVDDKSVGYVVKSLMSKPGE